MKKMNPWSLREKIVQVGVLDIALLALSVVFLLGMLLFFGPCGLTEDGSWMTCHWAGRTITGIAGAMVVLELLHALFPNAGIRQGLDLGALLFAALAILTPGRLVDLCMMNTMRCHTVMVPAVRVFATLFAAVSVVDFVIQTGKELRRESRRRHERRKAAGNAETPAADRGGPSVSSVSTEEPEDAAATDPAWEDAAERSGPQENADGEEGGTP